MTSSAERRVARFAAHFQTERQTQMNNTVQRQNTAAASEGEVAKDGEDVRKIFEADGVDVYNGALTNPGTSRTLDMWHRALECGLKGADQDMLEILEDIMDDNVVFLAPTYWKERRSKEFIKYALVGVTKAFKNFKYTRIFLNDKGFALEFECNVETEDGPFLRGVDMVTVDTATGKITRFEVMCRPPKAVLKLLDFQTAFMRKMGLIPPAKNKSK